MQTKRLPRPVALIVAGATVIGLVALVGVPHLMDGARQGQALAQKLASATGQQVRIDGPVRVSLWPTPHLAIGQLKLLDPATQAVLLSAPRVDMSVSWGSLFGGTYDVSAISLINPEIALSPSARPSLSWLQNVSTAAKDLSVKTIALSEATFTLQQGDHREVVENLSAKLSLPSSSTLLQISANGQWRGAPVAYDLDIGAPLPNTPAMFSTHLQIGAAETSLQMNGLYAPEHTGKPVEGLLELKAAQGSAVWALASSLGFLPTTPADPGLAGPISLAGTLEAGADGYVLRALKLTTGSSAANSFTAQGSARFVSTPVAGLSVALQTSVLDLTQWPSLTALASGGQFSLPASGVGAFDLAFAGLKTPKFTTSPVQAKGEIAGGQVRLSNLAFTLPGATQVKLEGTITPKAAAPAEADLKLAMTTTDLRGLLVSLGMTLPPRLDDGALRQANLTTTLRGAWTRPGLTDVQLKLDGMDITGQVSVRNDSGRYDANLSISQLDVNRYAALGTGASWIWQLPPSSLNLAFHHVRLAGQSADAVNLSADLDPGLLTIKALDAADFGGNRFRLSGTLSPDVAKASDLVLRLSTPDFAVLRESFAPVADLLPDMVASRLSGPMDVTVRWRNADGAQQRLSSLSLGGDGRLDLVMTTRSDAPRTWKARLQQRETAQLLSRMAPSILVRPDVVLGPLDLYAEGTEQDGGLWQISALQGQVAGMGLQSGDLVALPGSPLQLNGQIQIATASLDLWQQTLLPLQLARVVTGALDLSAGRLTVLGAPMTDVTAKLTLAPDGHISLPNFTGRWREGTVALTGEAQLGDSTTLKGKVDLRAANVEMRAGSRFGLSGLLDLSLDLSTSGQDSREWLANLEGSGDFALDSGSFIGIDFAALTEALQASRTTANLPVLLNRSGQTTLSAFGGDITIEDGLAKGVQLRFRTPSASADLTAQMDLAGPRLDITSDVLLREFETAPPFHLQLSGSLDNLNPTFDVEALSQFFKTGTTAAAKPAANANATTDGSAPATDSATSAAAIDPDAESAAQKGDDTTAAMGADDIKPPEPPVPPAAEAETASSTASSAAGAPAPSADSPTRATRRSFNRRPAAAESEATAEAAPRSRRQPAAPADNFHAAPADNLRAAPADDMPPAASGSAPPSIQELLSAMPNLAASAQTAVSEARATPAAPTGSTRSAGARSGNLGPIGGPQVDFAPQTQTGSGQAQPRLSVHSPARSASPPALAPEFEGVSVHPATPDATSPVHRPQTVRTADGARETRTDGLIIRLPPESAESEDVGSGGHDDAPTAGSAPAASVQDLMSRVSGE